MRKTVYLDKKQLKEQAAKIRSEALDLAGLELRHRALHRPAALLITDMQKYFIDPESHAFIPSASAIIDNILMLKNRFIELGMPVIISKHVNYEMYSGMMGIQWKDVIWHDDPMAEIIPELEDSKAIELEKSQYDAFYKTNLNEILIEHHCKSLVVCGVMTNLCCETSARSAFVRGYDAIIPVDATATYNRRMHLSSFVNTSFGLSAPFLTNEFIERLI